jgi:hypothetical protein
MEVALKRTGLVDRHGRSAFRALAYLEVFVPWLCTGIAKEARTFSVKLLLFNHSNPFISPNAFTSASALIGRYIAVNTIIQSFKLLISIVRNLSWSLNEVTSYSRASILAAIRPRSYASSSPTAPPQFAPDNSSSVITVWSITFPIESVLVLTYKPRNGGCALRALSLNDNPVRK